MFETTNQTIGVSFTLPRHRSPRHGKCDHHGDAAVGHLNILRQQQGLQILGSQIHGDFSELLVEFG